MNIDMSFLPDGRSGEWVIDTLETEKRSIHQLISKIRSGRGYLEGGKIRRLIRGKVLVMSNTTDEINDFRYFVHRAHGKILINGLGIGCVVTALLAKENVSEIIVIEKSEDVIKLVAPHIRDKRFKVIHADCFDYQPPKGETYDAVWHDIWDNITDENLPEMARLHRKYGRRTKYQESWCKKQCQDLKKYF